MCRTPVAQARFPDVRAGFCAAEENLEFGEHRPKPGSPIAFPERSPGKPRTRKKIPGYSKLERVYSFRFLEASVIYDETGLDFTSSPTDSPVSLRSSTHRAAPPPRKSGGPGPASFRQTPPGSPALRPCNVWLAMSSLPRPTPLFRGCGQTPNPCPKHAPPGGGIRAPSVTSSCPCPSREWPHLLP